MNYLQSLHDASARLIKIEEHYYKNFVDQPELTPEHLDKYSLIIRKLYPELTIEISTDSAGAHMLFKVARDHVCCISTVENSIGLYDSFRANDDLGAALEHDPIYLGHLGEDWN